MIDWCEGDDAEEGGEISFTLRSGFGPPDFVKFVATSLKTDDTDDTALHGIEGHGNFLPQEMN